jgi:antitoxin HigA-1
MLSITKIITEVHNAHVQSSPPRANFATLCLEPLNLSVTNAAKALGVSRKTLSTILNGRAGISPEMAVRLSIAFGTSAELAYSADTI